MGLNLNASDQIIEFWEKLIYCIIKIEISLRNEHKNLKNSKCKYLLFDRLVDFENVFFVVKNGLKFLKLKGLTKLNTPIVSNLQPKSYRI